MGCLLKIILWPFEFIFETVIMGWFSMMQWIIPKNRLGKISCFLLKIAVGIFSGILLITFLIGILAAALTEATIADLWKLIFLPVGISILQILIGIIVRIATSSKRTL